MFNMAEAYAATHHQGAAEVLKELFWNLWLYDVLCSLVCVTLNLIPALKPVPVGR